MSESGKMNYERQRARKEVESEWGRAARIGRDRKELADNLFMAAVWLRGNGIDNAVSEAARLREEADVLATAAIGPKGDPQP